MLARLRDRIARWGATSSFPSEPVALRIGAVVVVLAIGSLWLAPLTASFWMDETVTVWAIRGTFAEMVARGTHVPVQQLPFFAVMWLAAKVGGGSEVAVRLPSTIASVVAAVGVYRIGRLFADRLSALVAVAVFGTVGTVSFAAADARPYALAMAALIWSTYFLIRWSDTARLGFGVSYAALAALAIYMHYTSGVILAVHAFYVARHRTSASPGAGQITIVAGALGALLLPVAAHAIALWNERGVYSFAATPGTRELADVILNVQLVAGFAVAAAIMRLVAPDIRWTPAAVVGPAQRFMLAWFLVPPVAMYVVSLTTDAKLFVPRYVMWGAPGLALLAGTVLMPIDPPKTRRLFSLIVLLVVCGHIGIPSPTAHGGEDWRGAVREARRAMDETDAPLLLQPALTEIRSGPSTEPTPPDDPQRSALVPYPVTGDVFILPSVLDAATEAALERLVTTRLLPHRRIVLLARHGGPRTDLWLRARLGVAGYAVENLGSFGEITALVWNRPGS